jgi:hypothetical protein
LLEGTIPEGLVDAEICGHDAAPTLLLVSIPALAFAQSGTEHGDWRYQKYSPLDQINRENVNKLQIAWTWKAQKNARPFGGCRGLAGRRGYVITPKMGLPIIFRIASANAFPLPTS